VNLQQIRSVRAIARSGLNLTAAAQTLHTSQPGISRQIRELEDELGVKIFVRAGKRITGLTPPGQAVLAIAERLCDEIENLRRVGNEFADAEAGSFVIAATHMQARHVLPASVLAFIARHPKVKLAIRQGSPRQLAEMVITGEADVAIATETLDHFDGLVTVPCYRWHHCVVVPKGHPLTKHKKLTVGRIAAFPIVTYDAAFTGRTALDETFQKAGVEMDVVLTAIDTDVIITYVRLGLGIGIISAVALDAKRDSDLVAIDAGKLFPERITKLAYRKGAYLRGYVKEFIEQFSHGGAELAIKHRV
jgi:DNA-binding transcriptional LysR family regulator